MDEKTGPHAKLIDDLGGPTAVAALIDHRRTPQAISQWKLPGREIAFRFRRRLHRIAVRRKLDIPPNFLAE